MRYASFLHAAGVVSILAAVAVFCCGLTMAHAAETKPATEGKQPGVTVESLEKVEPQQYDWGWIRWLMNSKINPDSKLTFGVVQIKANQRNPLHGHSNCEELLFVVEGSCEHRVGDRIDHLKKGDMIRIPAGVPHMARTLDEPMRAIIVYSAGERQFQVYEEGAAPE